MNKALKILLANFAVCVRIGRVNSEYVVGCFVDNEPITTAANKKLRLAANDAFNAFVSKQGLDHEEINDINLKIAKACRVQ